MFDNRIEMLNAKFVISSLPGVDEHWQYIEGAQPEVQGGGRGTGEYALEIL